jgi:peptidase M50B-like protein
LAYVSPAAIERLPVVLVLCAGLLAFGLLFVGWSLVKFAYTVVHEGGHAFVGSMFGHTIESITMDRHGNGLTAVKTANPKSFGSMCAGLAGYVGPAMFGVGGAALLGAGRGVAMLWISLAFLVVEFSLVRSFMGFVSMIVLGGMIFAVIRYAPLTLAVFFGYVWVWFLLLGGVRGAWELHTVRKEQRGKTDPVKTDVEYLKEQFGLPGPIWTGLVGLLTMGGLLVGAGLLLRVLPWH